MGTRCEKISLGAKTAWIWRSAIGEIKESISLQFPLSKGRDGIFTWLNRNTKHFFYLTRDFLQWPFPKYLKFEVPLSKPWAFVLWAPLESGRTSLGTFLALLAPLTVPLNAFARELWAGKLTQRPLILSVPSETCRLRLCSITWGWLQELSVWR